MTEVSKLRLQFIDEWHHQPDSDPNKINNEAYIKWLESKVSSSPVPVNETIYRMIPLTDLDDAQKTYDTFIMKGIAGGQRIIGVAELIIPLQEGSPKQDKKLDSMWCVNCDDKIKNEDGSVCKTCYYKECIDQDLFDKVKKYLFIDKEEDELDDITVPFHKVIRLIKAFSPKQVAQPTDESIRELLRKYISNESYFIDNAVADLRSLFSQPNKEGGANE